MWEGIPTLVLCVWLRTLICHHCQLQAEYFHMRWFLPLSCYLLIYPLLRLKLLAALCCLVHSSIWVSRHNADLLIDIIPFVMKHYFAFLFHNVLRKKMFFGVCFFLVFQARQHTNCFLNGQDDWVRSVALSLCGCEADWNMPRNDRPILIIGNARLYWLINLPGTLE